MCCHPVTTGVVVVTDIDTVYTTYCPLTNSQVYVSVKTVVCTEETCVPSPTSTSQNQKPVLPLKVLKRAKPLPTLLLVPLKVLKDCNHFSSNCWF